MVGTAKHMKITFYLSHCLRVQLAIIHSETMKTRRTVPGHIVMSVFRTKRVLKLIRFKAPILLEEASVNSLLCSSMTLQIRYSLRNIGRERVTSYGTWSRNEHYYFGEVIILNYWQSHGKGITISHKLALFKRVIKIILGCLPVRGYKIISYLKLDADLRSRYIYTQPKVLDTYNLMDVENAGILLRKRRVSSYKSHRSNRTSHE